MRRLQSLLPNEQSSAGLLLLRVALAMALLADAYARFSAPNLRAVLFIAAEIPMGILLLAGLWTSVTAALIGGLELAQLPMPHKSLELLLFKTIVAVSLAFLGAGAWSLDARLFGPKLVDFQHLNND